MKKVVRRLISLKIADKIWRISQTKSKKVVNKRTFIVECPFKIDFIGFIFESYKRSIRVLSFRC